MLGIAPLADDQLRVYVGQAQEGSEYAMERLVESNVRLIQFVVNRFQYTGYDPEDLFQIGSIGFIKSVHSFDLDSGYMFATYAVPIIQNEIYDFLRKEGIIKVPRSIQRMARMITQLNLYEETPEEISKTLDADLTLVKNALQHIHSGKVYSLNKVVYESERDDLTLEDTLSGDLNGDWFDSIQINDALDKLDKRERAIIELRYLNEINQNEVAENLAISQAQVSRIEKRAILKLKELIGGEQVG